MSVIWKRRVVVCSATALLILAGTGTAHATDPPGPCNGPFDWEEPGAYKTDPATYERYQCVETPDGYFWVPV